MPIDRHPIPRRPIGAILEARRREQAALAARCRSFGLIAEALAHYGRERGPTPAGADRPSRWERLGDFAGVAASADGAELRTAAAALRRGPDSEPPLQDRGARTRARETAVATPFVEARS